MCRWDTLPAADVGGCQERPLTSHWKSVNKESFTGEYGEVTMALQTLRHSQISCAALLSCTSVSLDDPCAGSGALPSGKDRHRPGEEGRTGAPPFVAVSWWLTVVVQDTEAEPEKEVNVLELARAHALKQTNRRASLLSIKKLCPALWCVMTECGFPGHAPARSPYA